MESNLAVVSLYEFDHHCRVPVFCQDDRAVANMAVRYFITKGFCHYAFCGIAGKLYSANRERGVAAALESSGFRAGVYRFRQQEIDGAIFARKGRAQGFLNWLRRQPKPLALFAGNDDVACVAPFLCRAHGIGVPDEVAILGVDNYLIRTCLVDPYQSSVQTDASRIGYEAARHLEQMMASGDREPVRCLFPPLRVHERASSAIRVVDDPLVKSALELINEEPNWKLSITQVAERLGVCRNTLDARFRKALRCSVHEQLLAAKLNQAQMKLEGTALTVETIAHEAGLSKEHFCRVFKQTRGQSPGAYRESMRRR